MNHLSTGGVASLLAIHRHRLDYLTRDRQIRPAKGPTGAFIWTFADVIRAAELLGLPSPSPEAFARPTECAPTATDGGAR